VLVIVTTLVAVVACSHGGRHIEKAGPASTPALMLDGTYRLDFDATQQLASGAPTPYDAFSRWFAFRSTCTSRGCIATGTRVRGDDTRQPVEPAFTVVLDYQDGQWQTTFAAQEACRDKDIPVLVSWSLKASDDNTLAGTRVESAVTPGCAYNTQMPIEVFRLGDTAPSVVVADPAAQPTLRPSLPSALSGRYSGRVSNPVTGATQTRPVEVRSACVRNTDQCRMLKTATRSNGTTLVQAFHYSDGKWSTDLQQAAQCSDGTTGDADSHWEYVMPKHPTTPISTVTGTQHQVSTGACATTTDFDLLLSRTGD
jgi:hypothetical protein